MVDAAQHATLRLRVLYLVFLLYHRFAQHFHRVDLLLSLLTHLEHLAETALADHFQNIEALERHGRVVQLGILIAVVRIITTWTTSVE